MSKKNKDNDIIVSCLGTSRDKVTGSCWSISYPKINGERGLIVLECGLDQSESTIEKQYNSNKRMLENIGKDVVESCEYVILGHSHVDHVGNLSYFNDDNGFKGKILGSKPCIEIAKELIKDSVHIHTKNIEYLNSLGRKSKPLYTEPQMHQVFNHMESIPIDEKIRLNDYVTLVLHHNNHVVGATSISLYIRKPNNRIMHILYSSDMGNSLTQDLKPFLKNNELPRKCNLFITEATYNNKERTFTKKDALEERKWLREYITQCLKEDKRILFATFSFARSQEILEFIYKEFKDEEWFLETPIVVDGLLMSNINRTYMDVLDNEDKEYFTKILTMKNIKVNKGYDGTIACLSKRTSGIYLASSGFCQAGRIMTYLPQFLSSKNDVIILTGYAGGEGSIPWKMLNPNQKTVTIDKQVIGKRAEVKQLKTWSSHIGYYELLDVFKEMKCDRIVVHHSSNEKEDFCNEAKEYLKSKGITTPIIPTGKGCWQFIL